MIYTSYYAQVKKLMAAGIEPIAISRGKPQWFTGASIDSLAPTWKMLKMDSGDYDREYEKILAMNDPHAIAEAFKGRDVALLCYEKDINDCHRKMVGEWLRKNGVECIEFAGNVKSETKGLIQEALF